VGFDLHGRPLLAPPPLLELVDWPPCPLELALHQYWSVHYKFSNPQKKITNIEKENHLPFSPNNTKTTIYYRKSSTECTKIITNSSPLLSLSTGYTKLQRRNDGEGSLGCQG